MLNFNPRRMGRGRIYGLHGLCDRAGAKGQELLMEVMTECGSLMGGFNVGPAVSDVNLGTVTVNIQNCRADVDRNGGEL